MHAKGLGLGRPPLGVLALIIPDNSVSGAEGSMERPVSCPCHVAKKCLPPTLPWSVWLWNKVPAADSSFLSPPRALGQRAESAGPARLTDLSGTCSGLCVWGPAWGSWVSDSTWLLQGHSTWNLLSESGCTLLEPGDSWPSGLACVQQGSSMDASSQDSLRLHLGLGLLWTRTSGRSPSFPPLLPPNWSHFRSQTSF